ncbi:MAG TPA: carboxypeptidase regulatory-like domain-containing protein, partial [Opitutaceae bacterium]|nr:carboxypeptidase regulatory-like domain-containing protein [Opitutaceae bacterium]
MLLAGACAFAIALFSSSSGFAQGVTTAGLAGFVNDANGHPIAGATVTVLDVPTGAKNVTHTNSVGQYVFASLLPGGPYTVTVTAPNMTPAEQENVELNGGEVAKVDLSLTSEVVTMNAVQVSAEQDPTFSNTSMSQTTTFNAVQIQQIESVRRDIQDIQNLDPRATVMQVSPTDSQYTVSFDGFNPKENLLLIDGVSANDNFGLNSNGYAGFRNPAPPEWIQSMTVDLNPYDLIYSGFAGGVTNLTIKSGTNDFHGDFYEIYMGTNFRGPDPVPGSLGKHEKVQEHTSGGTLGGPIIKNKLFFFVGYDAFREIATPPPAEYIPDATALTNISQIVAHTEQAYGFNPGQLEATTHIWQQNFVAKLDWNITDA